MFTDKRNSNMSDFETLTLSEPRCTESYSNMERHWKITDTITHVDGRVEVIEHENTVVNNCSNLIACLMKAQAGYAGLTYWAVGSGSSGWSNTSPPSPTVSDSSLLAETFRKAIVPATDIVFLDGSDNVTASVTNKIQITVTFLENEANGELREFALFGGNATSSANTGIMVNRKIHPLIYKTSGMKIQRVIKIIF